MYIKYQPEFFRNLTEDAKRKIMEAIISSAVEDGGMPDENNFLGIADRLKKLKEQNEGIPKQICEDFLDINKEIGLIKL